MDFSALTIKTYAKNSITDADQHGAYIDETAAIYISLPGLHTDELDHCQTPPFVAAVPYLRCVPD